MSLEVRSWFARSAFSGSPSVSGSFSFTRLSASFGSVRDVGRLLVTWMRSLTLCRHHETVKEFKDGRISLRCMSCLRVSPGVDWITTTPRKRKETE